MDADLEKVAATMKIKIKVKLPWKEAAKIALIVVAIDTIMRWPVRQETAERILNNVTDKTKKTLDQVFGPVDGDQK